MPGRLSELGIPLPNWHVLLSRHQLGAMMGLSLWSKNLAKLTLFCVQHGQHRAGCGDASMMGLSLWSENSAKLTLFCAPKSPKMLLTALLAGASHETAIIISLPSLGIFGYQYVANI